jgi:hypothetical protein
MKPVQRISEDIERLKTQDIQIDVNSVADKALQFSSGVETKSPLKKRMSVRGLFGSGDSVESPANEEEQETAEKKVEGREIKQDHELYALTYGMMLGIRVMVRPFVYCVYM